MSGTKHRIIIVFRTAFDGRWLVRGPEGFHSEIP